jgi:hypothetical protein
MEAFFSGAIEMAWRGQTSMHKPHPVQVSQSTIIALVFPRLVIPAKAGIHLFYLIPRFQRDSVWIPVFTGMTAIVYINSE